MIGKNCPVVQNLHANKVKRERMKIGFKPKFHTQDFSCDTTLKYPQEEFESCISEYCKKNEY